MEGKERREQREEVITEGKRKEWGMLTGMRKRKLGGFKKRVIGENKGQQREGKKTGKRNEEEKERNKVVVKWMNKKNGKSKVRMKVPQKREKKE